MLNKNNTLSFTSSPNLAFRGKPRTKSRQLLFADGNHGDSSVTMLPTQSAPPPTCPPELYSDPATLHKNPSGAYTIDSRTNAIKGTRGSAASPQGATSAQGLRSLESAKAYEPVFAPLEWGRSASGGIPLDDDYEQPRRDPNKAYAKYATYKTKAKIMREVIKVSK